MYKPELYDIVTPASFRGDMEMNNNGKRLTAEERGEMEALYKPFIQASRNRLMRAVKAGVRIGAGSDIYIIVPGQTRGQASLNMLRAYADSGMSPIEIVRAATMNNAELIGRQNEVGSLRPKALADIIAVTGDPTTDVSALKHVRFVMKAGQVVRNDVERK